MKIVRAALVTAALSVIGPGLRAQDPPTEAETLGDRIEVYLAEPDPGLARKRLREVTKSAPQAEAVLGVLARPPGAIDRSFVVTVPVEGTLVRTRVEVPAEVPPGSPPLPVFLQFRLARIPDTVRVKGVINAWPEGFDPAVGSETLRDAAEKIARRVAWEAGGDPRRLWLAGFSIGGHGAFDVALRRPHAFRGLIPMAGAPRRRDFRVLDNLAGLSIFAMVGAGDDRELIWNLRELTRYAPRLGFSYRFEVDDRVPGRLIPSVRFVPEIGPLLLACPPAKLRRSGVLVADAEGIRSPLFEITGLNEAETKVPKRIPVPAGLDRDAQRRKTIEATLTRRVSLSWKLIDDPQDSIPELKLESDGVERAQLFVRPSWLGTATRFRLRVGEGRAKTIRVRPKVKTILEDLRRTGLRSDPCLMVVPLRLPKRR